MVMDMQFDCCGSLRAPVLVLLVSLGIYVQLENEGLDISLVLDFQEAILVVLSQVQIIFDFGDRYINWSLVSSSIA